MTLALIEILRPKQWYKNILIFIPIIASLNISEDNSLFLSTVGFVILCISSGGAYVLNDVIDIKKDSIHPEKKLRAIPAGKITKNHAILFGISLIISSEIFALLLNEKFFLVNSILIASMILYSVKFKNIFLMDIFAISINYVLRAIAGAYLIDVKISPWLIIGIFFLALLLALGKRKSELMFLKENSLNYRKVLKKYSHEILNPIIILASSITIITYSLYAMNGPEHIGDWRLVITIPVAFFILITYLNNLFSGNYHGKELNDVIITDKKLSGSILVYILMTLIIIYLIPHTYFK